MSVSNLAIVFGPTLFSQGLSTAGQNMMLDPTMQNKVRVMFSSVISPFPCLRALLI